MSTFPNINNLLLEGHEIDKERIFEPTPLSSCQLKEIDTLGSACSNSRTALHSGLRVMGHMFYASSQSEESKLTENDLCHLASFMDHIANELESISAIEANLDWRVKLAYLHSQDKSLKEYMGEIS